MIVNDKDAMGLHCPWSEVDDISQPKGFGYCLGKKCMAFTVYGSREKYGGGKEVLYECGRVVKTQFIEKNN